MIVRPILHRGDPIPGQKSLLIGSDTTSISTILSILGDTTKQTHAILSQRDCEGFAVEYDPDVAIIYDLPSLEVTKSLCHELNRKLPNVPLIVISTKNNSIEAMHFLSDKIFCFLDEQNDLSILPDILKRAQILKSRHLKSGKNPNQLSCFIEKYRGMPRHTIQSQNMRKKLITLCDVTNPILLYGEPGSGTRSFAIQLHKLNGHHPESFNEISSCQFDSNRLYDDLMHKVENVMEGTILLKHIDTCSQMAQSRILSLIERNYDSTAGGHSAGPQFICSTSTEYKNLETNSDFQLNLLRQISGLTVKLPALRNRHRDLISLFGPYLRYFETKHRIGKVKLTTEDIYSAMGHNWPGNIRELCQVAERWVVNIRQNKTTRLNDVIHPDANHVTTPSSLRAATAAFEAELIKKSIDDHDGRMDEVAVSLGIPRRTLNHRIVKLNISRKGLSVY